MKAGETRPRRRRLLLSCRRVCRPRLPLPPPPPPSHRRSAGDRRGRGPLVSLQSLPKAPRVRLGGRPKSRRAGEPGGREASGGVAALGGWGGEQGRRLGGERGRGRGLGLVKRRTDYFTRRRPLQSVQSCRRGTSAARPLVRHHARTRSVVVIVVVPVGVSLVSDDRIFYTRPGGKNCFGFSRFSPGSVMHFPENPSSRLAAITTPAAIVVAIAGTSAHGPCNNNDNMCPFDGGNDFWF